MKKLLTLGIACLISLPHYVQAEQYCDSNMRNLSFFSAAINENGNVNCTYRYCYYTCTYDSYSIIDKFKPGQGSWVKTEGKNTYACIIPNGSPRACPFYRNNQ